MEAHRCNKHRAAIGSIAQQIMCSLPHFTPLSSTKNSQPQLPPHVRLKHIRQQRHQHRHHATRVSLLQRAPALLRQEVAVQTQHQLHQLHVPQRLQQRLQLIGGNGRQNAGQRTLHTRVEGSRGRWRRWMIDRKGIRKVFRNKWAGTLGRSTVRAAQRLCANQRLK